ncbi:hypothetical protein EDB85DRAFT_1896900 [Lactarius pseudohatsudake]|nr:hypothetical protein EDB85DRAFT_1896900 [Lactarius pseudohatsudake]
MVSGLGACQPLPYRPSIPVYPCGLGVGGCHVERARKRIKDETRERARQIKVAFPDHGSKIKPERVRNDRYTHGFGREGEGKRQDEGEGRARRAKAEASRGQSREYGRRRGGGEVGKSRVEREVERVGDVKKEIMTSRERRRIEGFEKRETVTRSRTKQGRGGGEVESSPREEVFYESRNDDRKGKT